MPPGRRQPEGRHSWFVQRSASAAGSRSGCGRCFLRARHRVGESGERLHSSRVKNNFRG
jgi:hypothetical protein